MKRKEKYLILLSLSMAGCLEAYAQQSTNTAGGDAVGSGGTVSYSIGQTAYVSEQSNQGSNFPGVQQAFEIFITSNKELSNVHLSVKAYPNPVSTNLTLEVERDHLNQLQYSLFDQHGKCLITKAVTESFSVIDLPSLPSSVYHLKVQQGNREIKSFKIIKK